MKVVKGAAKTFAGDRLRRLREGRGASQAAVAAQLRVSPSYLSQLEADLRPLPVPLRRRVAALFGVPESHLADDGDTLLASSLQEASGDPLFGRKAVARDEVQAAVRAAPDVAGRFLSLYRAFLALQEENQSLRARAAEGETFVAAPRSPYDEVGDWVQERRNHFDVLDRAAEEMAERGDFRSHTLREDLARFLRDRHGYGVSDSAALLAEGTVWRLQRGTRTLLLAEEASAASRVFWMAHVVALLEHRGLLAREIRTSGLSTAQGRALAQVALANYFAGALVMPYGRFLREARAVRYDIERLQNRFAVSFEQVCHRLSTMQRPGDPGIPFFLVKTDIAGNVLKRSSATRFKFARFGGPCPLWNVYRAFTQPGRLIVQVARTPDEVAYLNIARTVGPSGGAYLSRPRNVAMVIGCEVAYAAQTVYAAGLDLSDPAVADPIGPGCRACERTRCRHRAVPPASHSLDVGTSERGVVPYRVQA